VAVIVTEPGFTPVTGTFTVSACAGKVKVAGTVAVLVSLELRETLRPCGAGPDSFNTMFCVVPVGIVVVPGGKLNALLTTTFAEPLTYPGDLTTIVAEPSVRPVTVKVPVVPPGGMVTLGGSKSTIPIGMLPRTTATPPGVAGGVRVIVPLTVLFSPTFGESRTIVILGFTTFTTPVAVTKPGDVAVIVLLPVLPVAMEIFVPVEPAGIVAFSGTVATDVSLLNKLTTWPLGPAGPASVIVNVPNPFLAKFNGLGVRVIVGVKAAVIITVAGLLLANMSLTIN
jgi:hypothetical protein